MNAVDWLEALQAGQLERFEENFHAFLTSHDEDEMYTLATGLVSLGFLTEGKQLFEELYKRLPDESILLINLAEILLDEGEEEEAVLLLERISSDDDCYLNALLLLAECYESFDMPEVSEAKLRLAYEMAPNEPIIQFAYAEILFLHGDLRAAIPIYQKMNLAAFNHVSIVGRIAESLAILGDYQEALTYFHQIDEFGQNMNLLFLYGLTAYSLQEYDLARRQLLTLIEKDKEYQTAYFYLAKIAEQEQDFAQALQFAHDGLKINNQNKELKLVVAENYVRLNRNQEAVALLQEIIAFDSNYMEAILLLAKLYLQLEDFEAAIALASTDDEDDPQFAWILATAYVGLEEFDQAAQYFEAAAKFFAENIQFLEEYSQFLIEEGKPKKAKSALEKLVELDPLNTDAQDLLERLED